VWTSTLKRSIGTGQYINYPKVVLKQLDEMDVGTCEGMTYDEMAERMPDEYAARYCGSSDVDITNFLYLEQLINWYI
jgi:broad specificity phosphatase PhoE